MSRDGGWQDVTQIVVNVDIVGEQAAAAISYSNLVIDEAIVDGQPITRVNRSGKPVTAEQAQESEEIDRGDSRFLGESPEDRLALTLRFENVPGAKTVDRISGSVNVEVPEADWIRITDLAQGPIEHPKFQELNIAAAVYRPVASVVDVEFAKKPPYVWARLVDADGNVIEANRGTGSRGDEFVVTLTLDEAPPEGAVVELTFEPLPTFKLPFEAENLPIKKAR